MGLVEHVGRALHFIPSWRRIIVSAKEFATKTIWNNGLCNITKTLHL